MVVQSRPLAEVTRDAIPVLLKETGAVDTMRFVGQFSAGYGNYTEERDALFSGMILKELIAEIKHQREE